MKMMNLENLENENGRGKIPLPSSSINEWEEGGIDDDWGSTYECHTHKRVSQIIIQFNIFLFSNI